MTAILPRQPSAAPPKGVRKAIPLAVKVDACLLLLGMEPGKVEWNHMPALGLRSWTGSDFEPAQLDPRYIVPMPTEAHRERTAKVDVPAIARTKRCSIDQQAFRDRMTAKATGAALPEQKRKRAWPKRPFEKRRAR